MEGRAVVYNPDSMPPREAWKNPTDWLGAIHPDKRIVLPTDDRGFVQVENAFDRVMDLFHDNYKWEFIPDDFRTIPDFHHFYYYEKEWEMWATRLAMSDDKFESKNANAVIDFRNNPSNIGWMLRGIHNALHHTTQKPEMPSLEPIVDFNTNFSLASIAFGKVFDTATGAIKSSEQIKSRRRTVKNNPDIAPEGDPTGSAILGDKYDRKYKYLQKSLREFLGVDNKEILLPDGEAFAIDHTTPLETIIELGKKIKNFGGVDFRPRN